MRTVKFTWMDRLVLTPVELTGALKPAMMIFGILFLLNSIGFGHFGLVDLYAYLGAVVAGCVLTPVLLPWIPGRAFSFKGFLLGFLWALAVNTLNGWPNHPSYDGMRALAYILVLSAVSAYGAMNFTGCSTFTSLSGVQREMKTAVPLIIASVGLGVVLLLIESILKLFI